MNDQKEMFLHVDVCMYGQKDDGWQKNAQVYSGAHTVSPLQLAGHRRDQGRQCT